MAKTRQLEGAEEHWNAVIGRALCFLCLAAADLRDKPIAAQAKLVEGLGLSRKDAAAMLGTTPASLSELLRQQRNKKRGSNGKKKR